MPDLKIEDHWFASSDVPDTHLMGLARPRTVRLIDLLSTNPQCLDTSDLVPRHGISLEKLCTPHSLSMKHFANGDAVKLKAFLLRYFSQMWKLGRKSSVNLVGNGTKEVVPWLST